MLGVRVVSQFFSSHIYFSGFVCSWRSNVMFYGGEPRDFGVGGWGERYPVLLSALLKGFAKLWRTRCHELGMVNGVQRGSSVSQLFYLPSLFFFSLR